MTQQAATYVRITDGGTPEFITRQQATDEVDSASSGPLCEEVVQMSANRTGANLTYRDGRQIEIRKATDADKPAEAPSRTYKVIFTGAGEPIVHAAGCSHNLRDSEHGAHQVQTITGTLTDVAAEVFSDFIGDGGDPTEFLVDLHVKPCAR